jgi:membrane-associated phospholipid phosphatase
VLPPAIVFCTTTYLAFHWITDSVAGLLLGVVLTRLLSRIPYDDIPLPGLPAGWSRSAGLTRAVSDVPTRAGPLTLPSGAPTAGPGCQAE